MRADHNNIDRDSPRHPHTMCLAACGGLGSLRTFKYYKVQSGIMGPTEWTSHFWGPVFQNPQWTSLWTRLPSKSTEVFRHFGERLPTTPFLGSSGPFGSPLVVSSVAGLRLDFFPFEGPTALFSHSFGALLLNRVGDPCFPLVCQCACTPCVVLGKPSVPQIGGHIWYPFLQHADVTDSNYTHTLVDY